jgi:sugar phosphate isomerase/epimerase
MQTCIAISTSEAQFAALAMKADFKDSLRKVAELGYDAVELAIRDPRVIDVNKIKRLLRKFDLPVPAIATGQAYVEEGLSFADPAPEIRRKAVERVKSHIDLALEIGGSQVIIGLIRGTVKPGRDKEETEKYLMECLSDLFNYRPGITLAMEPINRYETNLYNDTHSLRQFIDQTDHPNLKMLVDTFHMNIEEPDMIESILNARDYISHVHFADSNRWAPGCGHLNFKEILKALGKIGYQGAISAEILPRPSQEECMKLTIQYYRTLGLKK